VLGRLGLTFDAWLLHPQIGELETSRAHSPTRASCSTTSAAQSAITLCRQAHMDVFLGWAASIRRARAAPNVFVKVGGLGMRVSGVLWLRQATRALPSSPRRWPRPGAPNVDTKHRGLRPVALHARKQLPRRTRAPTAIKCSGTPASSSPKAPAVRSEPICSPARPRGFIGSTRWAANG